MCVSGCKLDCVKTPRFPFGEQWGWGAQLSIQKMSHFKLIWLLFFRKTLLLMRRRRSRGLQAELRRHPLISRSAFLQDAAVSVPCCSVYMGMFFLCKISLIYLISTVIQRKELPIIGFIPPQPGCSGSSIWVSRVRTGSSGPPFFCCFPRHIRRQLDWQQNGQDLNKCSALQA